MMRAYRPEIDGLRALAVISVLLFHLGVPHISGGYVGVDVFFVVSGFLITRLIRTDIDAGVFGFWRFYVRRARRLAPALIFTLAVTAIGACLLFSPAHLENFGRSLIAASLSVSNFQFWNESGYFDLTTSIKPLLHTWSLSVEEQFYLIWPAALWLLLPSARSALAVIIIAGVISFAMNFGALRWFAEGPATIFYLLPFRIFEFAIGAATAFASPARRALTKELLTTFGLALIVGPILTYDENTLFPSYNAIAPCLGSALVIYAGDTRYVGALLRNRLAVGIGLISYSLYLIHWPAIVFWRYVTLQPLAAHEQAAVAIISVTIAFVMYRYIETPFRAGQRQQAPQRRFVVGVVSGSVAAVLAGAFVVATHGWPQRIPSARMVLTPGQYEAQEDAACGAKVASDALVTCSAERQSNKSIYVWGDSHAKHLIAGLSDHFPDFNIRILYFTGCRAESGLFGYFYSYEGRSFYADACAKRNQDALTYFSTAAPTTILLHHFMSEGEIDIAPLTEATKRLIQSLKSYGHHVKFIGDVIRPSIYLPDCYSVPATIPDRIQNRRCRGDVAVSEKLAQQNDQFARRLGSDFVNPNAAFMDQSGFLTAVDGQLLFRDTNHLTPFGSRYFIGRLMSMTDLVP